MDKRLEDWTAKAGKSSRRSIRVASGMPPAGSSFQGLEETGDRQHWQRNSGKLRRKFMPVLGDRGQTGLAAKFRQTAPEIHASLVSPLQLIFVLFHGHAHELAARAHAGFLEQALEDSLDVAFRDLHPPGNFFVGKAFQDEARSEERRVGKECRYR